MTRPSANVLDADEFLVQVNSEMDMLLDVIYALLVLAPACAHFGRRASRLDVLRALSAE